MKTYKELLEKDTYLSIDDIAKIKVGDKIYYKKNGKGKIKSGEVNKIKDNGYFYINGGGTAVDGLDILKK